MKRTVLILFVVAAVVGGTAIVGMLAAWWWMQRGSAATDETAAGFVSSDRLSISSIAAPPPWDAESPVTFRVTLLRSPGAASEWSEARPWWEALSLHQRGGGRESPVGFEIIEPRANPAADDEVQFATLALPADRLPTGPVELRARLERAEGDPLLSEDLRGSVLPGVRTARERVLAEAQVHVGAGRFDAALTILTTLGPPDTADCQILRADALAGVGRIEEAIDLLHVVLRAVPKDQEEPPVRVLHRLQELGQR